MAPRSPFRVNVTSVLRSGSPRDETIRGPISELGVTGSQVPAGADLVAELTFEPAGSAVTVRGTVAAEWSGQCRRCLEEVGGTVEVDVRETFEEHPEEGETYLLEHGEVDLEQMVREAVLPELPQAPLCDEECKGLCPECGANRNEGACGHEHVPTDDRWSVLDQLRDDT